MKKSLWIGLLIMTINLWGTIGFVVNSGSETLSRIDFESGEINNNFCNLGSSANRVVFSETHLYVVNSGDNNIQKIDIESGEIISNIYIGSSTNPYDIIIHEGYAYVSGGLSNMVYKINLSSNVVESSILVGNNPAGMAIYNNILFVGNTDYSSSYANCTVSVIDLENFEVIETITIEVNPQFLKVINNKIHVSCGGNWVDVFGKVCIIDPATFTVIETIELGGVNSNLALFNDKVYLGDGYGTNLYAYFSETYEIIYDNTNPFTEGGTMVAADEQNLFILSGEWGQNCIVSKFDLDENFICEYEVGAYATDIKLLEEPSSSQSNEIVISEYNLSNYPNPFNPLTTLCFELNTDNTEDTEIVIYNLKGQKVKQLQIANYELGINEVIWNGTDENNLFVSSGVYFYRLIIAGKQIAANRMLLLK